MKRLGRHVSPVALFAMVAFVGLTIITWNILCHCSNEKENTIGVVSVKPIEGSSYKSDAAKNSLLEKVDYQDDDYSDDKSGVQKTGGRHMDLDLNDIDCNINHEKTVTCKREGSEVYLPFSFVKNYFEVYGKMSNAGDGQNRFEFSHSYSTFFRPKEKYTPSGVFMSFEHYNVEARDRVKCVSGAEGVPISIQWGAHGYFYPVQIAQFGLSHYSKHLTEPVPPSPVVYVDGSSTDDWNVPDKKWTMKALIDEDKRDEVLEFNSADSLQTPGLTFNLEETKLFVLSLDIKFATNGSITLVVHQKAKSSRPLYISYVQTANHVYTKDNHIFYGIGEVKSWRRITRDVSVDVRKGVISKLRAGKKMNKKNKGPKVQVAILKIDAIEIRGRGSVDNITFSKTEHLSHFYDAAKWMVKNQDKQGGWPIMVKRKVSHVDPLQPGWYSAMAQGQAMSLLIRAYILTKDSTYMKAALKATKLFHIASTNNGILAKFMNVYSWYEEYPTNPSSFVLNGFIYSLIGLYDLKMIASDSDKQDAEQLYNDGMKSLKAMLLMYDTGSGSIYDLRHVGLGIAPNLARWDYHTTHINQLLLLASIDESPIFSNTAERWITYMKGKRASHN